MCTAYLVFCDCVFKRFFLCNLLYIVISLQGCQMVQFWCLTCQVKAVTSRCLRSWRSTRSPSLTWPRSALAARYGGVGLPGSLSLFCQLHVITLGLDMQQHVNASSELLSLSVLQECIADLVSADDGGNLCVWKSGEEFQLLNKIAGFE